MTSFLIHVSVELRPLQVVIQFPERFFTMGAMVYYDIISSPQSPPTVSALWNSGVSAFQGVICTGIHQDKSVHERSVII